MRKQRTFAKLTPSEIDQIAEWLRGGKYDDVRDRIAKPRPEGFGLELKSTRPLETLWKNLSTVDKINTKLQKGEKLTVSDLNAIRASDREDVPDRVHDAIMDTTLELATSGDNSPSDLLKLQQLADFPARAEYRTHKVEMELHRKQMSEKRFALTERAHQLRERIAEARLTKPSTSHSQLSTQNSSLKEDALGRKEDHLGYLARTREDIRRRARAKYGPHIHPYLADPAATAPLPHSSTVPEETANIPSTAEKPLGEPLSTNTEVPIEIAHSVEANTAASVTQPGNTLAPSNPSEDFDSNRKSIRNNGEPQPLIHLSNASSPSLPFLPSIEKSLEPCYSEPSAVNNQNSSPQSPRLSATSSVDPVPLTERVNNYTLARYYEAREGKDPTKVGYLAHRFTSKLLSCPCGSHLPCPDHGDFPKDFWELSSDDIRFINIYESKGLPYTSPTVILRERDKLARRVAAELSDPLDLKADIQNKDSALVRHAIKRWRAYIPRPPGTPPPDDSWNTECPCGRPLPCDHHDDLWQQVRYLKPWDPDYIKALTAADIPIYTPTADDLAFPPPCTNRPVPRGSETQINLDVNDATSLPGSSTLANATPSAPVATPCERVALYQNSEHSVETTHCDAACLDERPCRQQIADQHPPI